MLAADVAHAAAPRLVASTTCTGEPASIRLVRHSKMMRPFSQLVVLTRRFQRPRYSAEVSSTTAGDSIARSALSTPANGSIILCGPFTVRESPSAAGCQAGFRLAKIWETVGATLCGGSRTTTGPQPRIAGRHRGRPLQQTLSTFQLKTDFNRRRRPIQRRATARTNPVLDADGKNAGNAA